MKIKTFLKRGFYSMNPYRTTVPLPVTNYLCVKILRNAKDRMNKRQVGGGGGRSWHVRTGCRQPVGTCTLAMSSSDIRRVVYRFGQIPSRIFLRKGCPTPLQCHESKKMKPRLANDNIWIHILLLYYNNVFGINNIRNLPI